MKINNKRIMSITLATLITAGSTGIYAANFKDIPKNYWAKQYIDRCEELGLLKGYDDGTFKPAISISNLQVLVTLSRTLELPKGEIEKATKKYKAALEKNKIPEWAMGDIAVAVEKGITSEKSLETIFDKNGKETMGNREELSVLLINTMGLQQAVKNKGEITKLPGLIDAGQVTKSKMPFVLVLLEKGILRGDDNRNFNPKKNITRAEMATVLELAYDYIKGNGKPVPEKPQPAPEKPQPAPEKPQPAPEKPQPAPEKPKTKIVLGTTSSTFSSSGENYVIIETVTEGRKSYKLDSKSILKIDGKVVAYADLIAGINVKMEVLGEDANTQGTIVSLTGDSIVADYKGTLSDLKDTGSKTLIITYIEKGIETKKFIVVSEDAIITLDGKKASFADLKERDKASIKAVNGKVTKIDAEATTRTWTGKLDDVDLVSNSIAIVTSDGTRTLYGLDKNASIIRNDKGSTLSSLRKGDKIDISIENNLVTAIKAQVVKTEVVGLVQRTTIGYNKQEITILNNQTKKEETYQIPALADIRLDGSLSRLDQFKLGYVTKITLESDEVVAIDGESTLSTKHLGRITSIDTDKKIMTILIANGSTVSVDITDNTSYKIDTNDALLSFKSFMVRDNILVTGDIYQGRVIAKEVMKLTR